MIKREVKEDKEIQKIKVFHWTSLMLRKPKMMTTTISKSSEAEKRRWRLPEMEALQKKVDSPAIEEKVKEVLEEVWVQEEEAFSRTLLKELIDKWIK